MGSNFSTEPFTVQIFNIRLVIVQLIFTINVVYTAILFSMHCIIQFLLSSSEIDNDNKI